MTDLHPLDHPVLASLSGAHARFATSRGNVARYPRDVCPFIAMPIDPAPQDWADAAALSGPGELLMTAGVMGPPPDDWEPVFRSDGVQLVDEGVDGAADEGVTVLGIADVDEMLALVELTRPGPFRHRTIEMGSYLGIRKGGALVAMAGERLHPTGYREISAVCTHPDHRGKGLAARLIRAIVHGARARGETPFLHATADNHGAIALYEALGFRLRREIIFQGAVHLGTLRRPSAGIHRD